MKHTYLSQEVGASGTMVENQIYLELQMILDMGKDAAYQAFRDALTEWSRLPENAAWSYRIERLTLTEYQVFIEDSDTLEPILNAHGIFWAKTTVRAFAWIIPNNIYE